MVDVAIRDTIRAHFGQYPPEHQHTSITTRLTAGAILRINTGEGGVIGVDWNAKCAR